MNPIKPETLDVLKKVLKVAFEVFVGFLLFFVLLLVWFFVDDSAGMDGGVRQRTFSESTKNTAFVGSSPSAAVNVTLPDEGVISPVGYVVEDTSSLPSSSLSAQERKLVQNGELSLIVNRVEDSVIKLSSVAESLGGRVDSVEFLNRSDAEKKQATVMMRIPAVNFSNGMDQVKSIALKIKSENVSTEDVTEKFIDMQARLKNLKAEESQYLDIMQKASKIDDVLMVSQRLYSVRQQIEQLQGQMNYLSRQVDMSIIRITLSSESDMNPTNVSWSLSGMMKSAVQLLIDGFYFFLSVIILLAVALLPILLLWVMVIAFGIWVLRKLFLSVKRYIEKV
jgi:hypothetical protein